ncbi:MAG TPA: DUF1761 domain-containing protein [Bacteroidia bacterium]|jgi:hypothetical protein|uniref:DUF1761 domain-containing protein n=1 Tax=Candidatus Pollutiaquabacter sp. TaxID=3416354 RepID=UPI001A3D4F70|nr:DUF1761 domain-containing protein [Bacteroidota bacterium]MBL7948556.1 DUF1761 domain-containing protein [Bacteroidia bacterium]HPD52881.1 DUF1761 domain-containing protein [Bacteroidia bacterium]HRS37619.1 DUF1761 domain-containing protein [Bacteroidia bacterium]HRU60862.1 DUF1761 domain-containing protein [Bacteroidia bacterium]
MESHWQYIFISALIPMFTGFIWYGPKTFGNVWMREAGVSEEKIKSSNMALILSLTYVFSLFLSLILISVVIHQSHILSILADDPGMKDPNSEISLWLKNFMDQYGQNFRTFKHGAFHGTLSGIFYAFPIIAINALFERRSWKYIWIHTGYWILTLALMGGIVCANF